MKIYENISLKKYNTFGVDVTARFLVEISSKLELKNFLKLKDFSLLNKIVIGGGSNILLTKNFDGVVIKINIGGINIINEDINFVVIESGAGVFWDELVNFCVDHNYGGIENLSFIPGTCGAAPMQNIGAYGQEIKDSIYSIDGIKVADAITSKQYMQGSYSVNYNTSVLVTGVYNCVLITKDDKKSFKLVIAN